MGATRAFWFALVVYTLVMGAVLYYRPRAFFLVAEKEETDRDENDSTTHARLFGVGKHKTVCPIWLLNVLVAVGAFMVSTALVPSVAAPPAAAAAAAALPRKTGASRTTDNMNAATATWTDTTKRADARGESGAAAPPPLAPPPLAPPPLAPPPPETVGRAFRLPPHRHGRPGRRGVAVPFSRVWMQAMR
jgi:hypothetical protein